jgi:hypothetical protein
MRRLSFLAASWATVTNGKSSGSANVSMNAQAALSLA